MLSGQEVRDRSVGVVDEMRQSSLVNTLTWASCFPINLLLRTEPFLTKGLTFYTTWTRQHAFRYRLSQYNGVNSGLIKLLFMVMGIMVGQRQWP